MMQSALAAKNERRYLNINLTVSLPPSPFSGCRNKAGSGRRLVTAWALAVALLACLVGPVVAGRDYYDLLGVPRDAPDSIIKKAYRQMARRYHPDKHPGDKRMEDKFKDISKAYEVLSDKNKRAVYDQYGEDGLRQEEQGGGGGPGGFHRGGFHFGGGGGGGHGFQMEFDESFFQDMFSGGGGGFGFGGRQGRGGRGHQQHEQRRKICFENKVCENGRCYMEKECKS